MQAVIIALILSVSIIQVYCDGDHTGALHSHDNKGISTKGGQNEDAAAEEAAAETAVMVEQTLKQLQVINQANNAFPRKTGPSNDDGFKFNYYFLWHSDATILNYLARNRGNGGQAEDDNSMQVMVELVDTAPTNGGQAEDDKSMQGIDERANTAPTKTVPSNGDGFKSDLNFLWHSDATILNYLARNRGNGGQADPASSAPAAGHNGGGHDHGDGHFGKHESLFRVLAGV